MTQKAYLHLVKYALDLPDRSKRIKRALKRGLDEIEDRKGVDA